MTTPDYPDYATPQAHANAIAITGAPLLTLAGTVLQQSSQAINGGAIFHAASIPITQIGYEIELSIISGVAPTVPFIDLQMEWLDGSGNFVVATEQWCIAQGTNRNNIVIGSGPTKGSTLLLSVTNLDPAVSCTVTVILLQNSRVYSRDRFTTFQTGTPTGFTSPNNDPLHNILVSVDAANVGVGASLIRLFPLYAGDVWFYVDEAGVGATNSQAMLQVAPVSKFGSAPFYSSAPSGGSVGGSPALLRFPRAPVLFTYTNNGTVAATVNLKAIMLDERM